MDPNPMISITSCDHGTDFWKQMIISDGHLEAQDDQNAAENIPISTEIKT